MGIKKTERKINKKIAALVIAVLVFVAVSLLHLIGAFHYLEYKSYDLRVRFFAHSSMPSHDIVVILLDQDSIDWAQQERGWGWPWPRRAYAELLDYMKLGEADSVAFDIIYSEPSMYRARDDEAFARAAAEYGGTVQAVFFSAQSGSVRAWPTELTPALFAPEGFGKKLDQFGKGRYGQALDGGQFPVQRLSESAAALGSITGTPDSDDVVRRLKLFTLFDGKAVPGLAAASLLVSGHDTAISYDSEKGVIRWGDFVIPVDKNGASLLRYRGDLSRYIPYSAKDVLQSAERYEQGEEPLYPPEDFAGTHIFFGLYAPGLFDIFATPISSLYPGMGAHITMLDNMLKGDFIRESRQWLNLLVLFAAIAFTIALCLFSSRIFFTVGGTIFAVFGIVAAAFAAYNGGLWLPMVVHLAGISIAFISATLYNYATEGSQKRFIKSAFSQYLSPKVIEQIIADPSQLQLGGEKREMTAIFTDVRSFSTISEALGDPTKLVELLNYYLTRMSNIVLDNQGTIDKYEGDAIIAFFGAPIHFDNHAALACRSAIMMKKAEAGINRDALALRLITPAVMEAMAKKGILKSADDVSPIFTRLGINTGDMVVGNMGTPSKMDYTIMGNAVNLAARLEGVNKQYNTGGILISEYTRSHIGDEFVLRPLSRVRVVGINTPLRLYELLDIRQNAPPALLEMVQNWERGFAAYEQKDFSAAENIFKEISRQNEADLAAKKYFERCQKYLASPPSDEVWDDGVDNLTEK
ncbi:MAG: adenylate/guanylate cyclase domain-containing protein [Treponema sp.]|jgi:adenylate cyclase|nr:adenylate/guanylate cyclase domain-containing protein [Treponema sp.]